MNKSNNRKTIFLSPHSMEECHKRLKGSVDTSFFLHFSSKQVAGKVSKELISIRKRINYGNSFQTVLKASLKPSENGTELLFTIGLHPFVKIFMSIWFGGLFVIGGLIFIITLSSLFEKNASADSGMIMGILIPPGMAIFGIALLKFGRYLARNESAFLKTFLVHLLDAKEINHVDHTAAPGSLVNSRAMRRGN
jgi:hypothetical protein